MMDKILVADDDLNICELLRLYLKKEGFEVVMAHDGEEAVAKFESEKPLSYPPGYHDAQAGWLAGLPADRQKERLPHHHAHRQGRNLR